jgi:outer membrane protein TolC
MRTTTWRLLIGAAVIVGARLLSAAPPLPAQEMASPVPSTPIGYRLTLDEAKQQALAQNRQLQLGRLNVDEKQTAISAAVTDYLPKVLGSATFLHFNDNLGSVVASNGRQLGGATIGPGGIIQIPTVTIPGRSVAANVVNQNAAFGALMVAQPITKLIGVSALVELARADEGIASAQLDKGTRDLLSGVTQAYYGLLAARRIDAALTLQVQAVEPLVKAKPTAELRLGLLEVRKARAETKKQIPELTELLNQLLGFPPGTGLELVEPGLPPVMVISADQAAEWALMNNPQVREAQQSITKACAGLKAAKMEYLPDVNVVAAYVGQNSADYIQRDFGFVGVTASYTFVDWGKRNRVTCQRETQIVMAHRNVDVIIESVQLETRKAFLAYEQAEEELQIANETVAARQDAEGDAKTVAEVMAAKAATAKAGLEQMQAELYFRLAHAKLLAIIGQL